MEFYLLGLFIACFTRYVCVTYHRLNLYLGILHLADITYPFQFFTSSSDGRLVAVDASTGEILWKRDFGYPIVGVYALEGDGLHILKHTIIGKETLISLIEVCFLLITDINFSTTSGTEISCWSVHYAYDGIWAGDSFILIWLRYRLSHSMSFYFIRHRPQSSLFVAIALR